MKVGIMSMQRIINYGSFLQAYGLKKIIEELGHDVQFVDYKIEKSLIPMNCENESKSSLIYKLKKIAMMFSFDYRKWRKQQIKLNQTFEYFTKVFREEYLPILGITSELNITPLLDTLVIGSDEVFNCTQLNSKVGYSKQLFGEGKKSKRLISYAASFGNTTIEKLNTYQIYDEVAKYLSNFDSISIRDDNSYNIVKTLTGIDPQKNIDPVLLYPFEEIDDIQIDCKDYIIVYAYADRITKEEAKAIRDFARRKKKKIVTLGFYQPFCDEWFSATPFEVMAYIKNADYVITDTFHGTVFSIKYQKKFGAIIRESNKEKLEDLLNIFELKNHQITDLNKLSEIVDQSVDSDCIIKILRQKQEIALNYLKKEL